MSRRRRRLSGGLLIVVVWTIAAVLLIQAPRLAGAKPNEFQDYEELTKAVVFLAADRVSVYEATITTDGSPPWCVTRVNFMVTGGRGEGDAILSGSELISPLTADKFRPAAPMNEPRAGHTANAMPNLDNWDLSPCPSGGLRAAAAITQTQKLLVAGGTGRNRQPLASAELYDLDTNTWTPTGSLAISRTSHTAAGLMDGRTLVLGGVDSSFKPLASAEVYDPATGRWSTTGSLAQGRQQHTTTLLPSGKVLVTGGFDQTAAILASAELYDPATGTWSPAGTMATARGRHQATLLQNGKVLVEGGNSGVDYAITTSAELYDPATNTWSPTGSLANPRAFHTATRLLDGRVVAVGGYSGFGAGNAVAVAELYDPATGTWSPTGSLRTPRGNHVAQLLPNGQVLVAGGFDNNAKALASTELYEGPGPLPTATAAPTTPVPPTVTPTAAPPTVTPTAAPPTVTPTAAPPTVTPTYSPTPLGTPARLVYLPLIVRASGPGW